MILCLHLIRKETIMYTKNILTNFFIEFLVKFFLLAALLWLIVFLLHSWALTAKDKARYIQYRNNWNCIAKAIVSFYDEKGAFPWEDRKHSWRVHILPYLDQKELYDQIHMEEPWNSVYNMQFHEQCPHIYQLYLPEDGFEAGKTCFSLLTSVSTDQTSSEQIIQLIDCGKMYSWMDPSADSQSKDIDLHVFDCQVVEADKLKFKIYYQKKKWK